MEEYLKNTIQGYRADPSGRFGGKDRMETRPTTVNAQYLMELVDGIKYAESKGMPKVSAETVVNKLLLEGREDLGTNEYNVNNKRAKALYDDMRAQGYGSKAATLAAAVLDKTEVANRLGIPFEKAWNGTGTSRATGRTGAQHAQRSDAMEYAAKSPKNKELLNLVSKVLEQGRTPREKLFGNIGAMEAQNKIIAKPGGQIRSALYTTAFSNRDANTVLPGTTREQSINALKILDALPPHGYAYTQMGHNLYRDLAGLPRENNPKDVFNATEKTLMEIAINQPLLNKILTNMISAPAKAQIPPQGTNKP